MEDVQHLVDAGKEESYLFVVDSRVRDTAVFPTPSEYQIEFKSPFKNVFGLDLLDASIARTEYIVEYNTNVLEYALGQPTSLEDWAKGAWVVGRKRTVTLVPGDYNLPQFVEHVNDRLAAVAAQNDEAALKCVPASNPSEIANKVVFTCAEPFAVLAGTSTLRYALGFGDTIAAAESPDYAVVPGWSVNRTGGASDVFLSKPSSDIPDNEGATAAFGPVPAGSMVNVQPVNAATMVRQHFVSTADGPASRLSAYAIGRVGLEADAPPDVHIVIKRYDDGVSMAEGTLTVAADDPNDVYVPVQCALTPVNGRLLRTGTRYFVEFSAQAGDDDTYVGLYYNQDNLAVDQSRYIEVNNQTEHEGQNLCVDLSTGSWAHVVRSPGLVNLTGPRYVVIRCPEIESHMFRDRVNETCHAGLGMVSLRGYGFREQRYDFVSFPPRRFHPLGKLPKLTFRLERPDGTLYDSHGVDHTLVLVLKYYTTPVDGGGGAAAPAERIERAKTSPASILNPAYTPNYVEQVTRKWREEQRALNRAESKRQFGARLDFSQRGY